MVSFPKEEDRADDGWMTITEDKEERLFTTTNRLLEVSNKKPKMSTEIGGCTPPKKGQS